MPTVVDVFCGAGGLSAGFQAARLSEAPDVHFRVVYGVDRDANAMKTYRMSHFHNLDADHQQIVAPQSDISQISGDAIRGAIGVQTQVDCLIGGPSCQGLSAAGLRNPDDKRNSMMRAFIRLVEELQPRWFVMENVPGLTHANNRALLLEIFTSFTEIQGYEVAGDVLLAADYGVPQLRYRLFIIGTRTNTHIRFPIPTHQPLLHTGQESLPIINLPPYKTLRETINSLAAVAPRTAKEDDIPEENELIVEDGVPIYNHWCLEIGKVNRDRIATIGEGEDWRAMPIGLLPERYFATRASDQKGAYGRLAWDWPAYTITNAVCNVTAGAFTHPEKDRMLSVREAARIQSFPDEYFFYGTLQSQYRQVGNAVPPKLAQAVAECILFCDTFPDHALEFGRPGRLTLEIIEAALAGTQSFPVLTPRHVEPKFDRRYGRKPTNRPSTRARVAATRSVWTMEPRPEYPPGEELRKLGKLAEQPGNYRAAKRARAILAFICGKPRDEIVRQAKVSETSVQNWVDGFFAAGLDGWRAYHTSVERLLPDDSQLAAALKKGLAKVRQVLLTPSQGQHGKRTPRRRLHMNGYLLRLIAHFQNYSVSKLIEEVEEVLGRPIGTVYVGDLLAIADVVLDARVLSTRPTPSHLARRHKLQFPESVQTQEATTSYGT